MKYIHDDQMGGIMMVPLIVDWDIARTCQIKDCEARTNAIVNFTAEETGIGEALHLGICEDHFQEAHASGKFHYTVDV